MNKKELTKRLGSFLLSGVLIVSSAVPVMDKTQENTASMSTATFISSEASLNAESLNSSINGESISEGSLSAEESEPLDAESQSIISEDEGSIKSEISEDEECELSQTQELTDVADSKRMRSWIK